MDKNENVKQIFKLTQEALDLNIYNIDVEKLAKLMGRGWEYKKQIHTSISNPFIDAQILNCYENGAWGAKLCGSGAGGCIFVLADPTFHKTIINCMVENDCKQILFKIDTDGVKQLQ